MIQSAVFDLVDQVASYYRVSPSPYLTHFFFLVAYGMILRQSNNRFAGYWFPEQLVAHGQLTSLRIPDILRLPVSALAL